MSAAKLTVVPEDSDTWQPPVAFYDEYHERIITISSTQECFIYLKDDWHLHGDITFYYDALKAVMRALDGTGLHADAREQFLRALWDVHAEIIRR